MVKTTLLLIPALGICVAITIVLNISESLDRGKKQAINDGFMG
jgi:hypothetical protein